jgi:hypothetical protein
LDRIGDRHEESQLHKFSWSSHGQVIIICTSTSIININLRNSSLLTIIARHETIMCVVKPLRPLIMLRAMNLKHSSENITCNQACN